MKSAELLGPWGEATAAAFLRRKGFRIEAMNYRTRLGEIDIIARNRSFLVFAEVKLRKSDLYGAPREFVTAAKQNRLKAAAMQYLSEHETALQPRFDVIEIYAPQGLATKMPRINHIENAFF